MVLDGAVGFGMWQNVMLFARLIAWLSYMYDSLHRTAGVGGAHVPQKPSQAPSQLGGSSAGRRPYYCHANGLETCISNTYIYTQRTGHNGAVRRARAHTLVRCVHSVCGEQSAQSACGMQCPHSRPLGPRKPHSTGRLQPLTWHGSYHTWFWPIHWTSRMVESLMRHCRHDQRVTTRPFTPFCTHARTTCASRRRSGRRSGVHFSQMVL